MIIMLIGEYRHNTDAKGRVIVPAKFRESLGDCFYVTKGLDGCLFVFPPCEWERLQQKIGSACFKDARAAEVLLFGCG